MVSDEKLRTEKITPELIDYIVEKIVREIQPEKIILLARILNDYTEAGRYASDLPDLL